MEVIIDGKSISIDSCIAKKIDVLSNNFRAITLACCCGHGTYPETIIVMHYKNKKIYEFNTMTEIPRKRKFYKRDAEGIYYIPEVQERKQ